MRTGAEILAILADPVNTLILREIVAGGPKSPSDIAGESGDERLYDLTPRGRQQIFVIALLDRWLEQRPGWDEIGAKEWEESIRALVETWCETIVHRFAAGPLSLAELHGAIEGSSLAILERHLEAMRGLGMLEPAGERGGQPVYAATDWLRGGIVPIVAASYCEQRFSPDESPLPSPLDVEAAFQLALPLLALPEELSGSCELNVQLPGKRVATPAGVVVEVAAGRVVSCAAGLEGGAETWASADVMAWFRAVVDGKIAKVKTDGRRPLGRCLVEALHELFRLPAP